MIMWYWKACTNSWPSTWCVCWLVGATGKMTRLRKPSVTPPVPTLPPVETTALVKFEVTAKNAEIWSGDEKLGVAPGPIKLPLGSELTLTIKAPGYATSSVKVTPKEGLSVPVTLVPAAAAKPKPSGTIHKDLDDPFAAPKK